MEYVKPNFNKVYEEIKGLDEKDVRDNRKHFRGKKGWKGRRDEGLDWCSYWKLGGCIFGHLLKLFGKVLPFILK